MKWLILPYDRSAVARATLRRVVESRRQWGAGRPGIVLAIAGFESEAVDGLLAEAHALLGGDFVLQAQILHPGDPLGSLRRLLRCLPNAVLAAPIGPRGGAAPWCAAAWRLNQPGATRVLFFVTPHDIRVIDHDALPTAARRWERVVVTPCLVVPLGLSVVTVAAVLLEGALAGLGASGLYLATVLAVAWRWGWAWGSSAAGMGAFLFSWAVVEPRLSLSVASPDDARRIWLTTGGMLLIVLLTWYQGSVHPEKWREQMRDRP